MTGEGDPSDQPTTPPKPNPKAPDNVPWISMPKKLDPRGGEELRPTEEQRPGSGDELTPLSPKKP